VSRQNSLYEISWKYFSSKLLQNYYKILRKNNGNVTDWNAQAFCRIYLQGNTEDEEEGEYSSECDNDVSSSRLPWSEDPVSTATTTTTITVTNRPLNPECQEFQLRPALQPRILSNPISTSIVTTVAEEVASSTNDASCYEAEPAIEIEKVCDIPIVQSPTNQEDATICNSENILAETPLESVQTATLGRKPKDKNVELNGQTNHLVANVETITTNDTMEIKREVLTNHKALSKTDTVKNNDQLISANAKHELLESNSNGINTDLLNNCIKHPKETLTNDGTFHETEDLADLIAKARSVSPRINTITEKPKKYNSKKGGKFVREPTPGPDLNDLDLENGKLVQQLMVVELCDHKDDVRAIADRECNIVKSKLGETNRAKAVNDEEAISEIRSKVDNTKMTSQDTIMSSNEDSGFESQTRLSEYPITTAVTEWLRRVNSPDLFVTSGSTSDSETDEDEEMDAKPPKNLQGNPMPALSANSGVDNVTSLSRAASCSEFAKTNSNNNTKIDQVEADSMLISTGRRKKDTKIMKRKSKTKRIEKRNRNVDEKTQSHLVSSLVSCDQLKDFVTAVRLRNIPKHNVGDVCEFTEKDSVAGMRVALSSRINTRGVNARRAKMERRINGNPIENIDIKMRRIDDLSGERGKKIKGGDSTVSVRTFEKGEIIVSESGKLLPTSAYEPVPLNGHDPDAARNAAYVDVINENVEAREDSRNNSENGSVMMSSVSIEEPDVLECWEAETIEPVITPKRLLQSPGILCDGEAAEEDNLKIEQATVEHVQKYYRLARDGGEPSELNTSVISSRSRTVPNHSFERKPIEHFCSEDIPVFIADKNRDVISADEKIPVDEAFEVYESCYTGKSPFLAYDSKISKERPLYGQNGEDPIPCRAVCCNLQ